MQAPLILASRSAYRARLLTSLGVPFQQIPADIDETPTRNEMPLAYVTRMARSKATALAAQYPDAVILAADTPVIVGRKILQTPSDEADAEAMLRLQSGRKVHVPTVVAMAAPGQGVCHLTAESWVKFKVLAAPDIQQILSSGHWRNCSGALQIDDPATERWLKTVHGSISGIIGLPLYQTARLLRRAGYQV